MKIDSFIHPPHPFTKYALIELIVGLKMWYKSFSNGPRNSMLGLFAFRMSTLCRKERHV